MLETTQAPDGVYPCRVDLEIHFTDGAIGIRQGVTAADLREAADAMDKLSNAHPMIFGPVII